MLTFGFDLPLPDWEATVRARHDLVLAFQQGEAVIEYQMKVGAGSSNGSRAIGLQLTGEFETQLKPAEDPQADPIPSAEPSLVPSE